MSKLFSKEYQKELLTVFGTVVIQGLMMIAATILTDVETKLKFSKRKSTTYRVHNDDSNLSEAEGILGENKLPTGDTQTPRDHAKPPKEDQ